MSANHYNLDYLKQVFQGNDAMVRRILDLFESEVPRYFEEMEDRMSKGAWRELHPLAHKAKSSIGMLGMQRLLDEVLIIEHQSRAGTSKEEVGRALVAARQLLTVAMAEMAGNRVGPRAPTHVRGSNLQGGREDSTPFKRHRA